MEESRVQLIVEAAARILQCEGLAVSGNKLAASIIAAGFELDHGRVRLPIQCTQDYIESVRKCSKRKVNTAAPKEEQHFTGMVNEYCSNLLDVGSATSKPFDTHSLINATDTALKLCRQYGQSCGVVGQPSDVPPPLQSLARSMVGTFCSPDQTGFEPSSRLSAKYLFPLAEICGRPIKRLIAYMTTPLGFGGENVETVLAFADRIDSIKVTGMPALGCTVPIDLNSALAMSLAESIGGAIILEALTGKPCEILVQLHPFDFRSMNFVYGTPETLILSDAANDFNMSLKREPLSVKRANIHVMAKLPGPQACCEKAAIITKGALNGAKVYNGIGALSLDEIFSPVQLVLDLEMLGWSKRLTEDWPLYGPRNVDEILENVREGLRGGYLGTDGTLDNMKSCVWDSRLFTRQSLSGYLNSQEKSAYEKACDMVRAAHTEVPLYRPTASILREMSAIWDAAYVELTGTKQRPDYLNEGLENEV